VLSNLSVREGKRKELLVAIMESHKKEDEKTFHQCAVRGKRGEGGRALPD